jgi:hypothetical protein
MGHRDDESRQLFEDKELMMPVAMNKGTGFFKSAGAEVLWLFLAEAQALRKVGNSFRDQW